MEIENVLSIECQLIFQIHHKLDGGFVIQDHLGFGCVLSLSRFAKFDKSLRVE